MECFYLFSARGTPIISLNVRMGRAVILTHEGNVQSRRIRIKLKIKLDYVQKLEGHTIKLFDSCYLQKVVFIKYQRVHRHGNIKSISLRVQIKMVIRAKREMVVR